MDSAPYRGLLAEASSLHNVPFWLLYAQAEWESGFDPNNVSTTGARGIMQIEPATAADCGCHDPGQLFDPAYNIDLGTRILVDAYNVFKNENGWERWKFALAAYNAGVGHIVDGQRAASGHGADPGVWANVAQYMPHTYGPNEIAWDWQQPIEYVEKIMARANELMESPPFVPATTAMTAPGK